MEEAMRKTTRRAALVALATVPLVLSACGGDDDGGGGGGGSGDTDCSFFEDFGDLSGKTITVYTSIVAPEDQPHVDSYKPFEDCTGATVEYQGDKEFETQLPVRVKAGNPPDVAYIPQPGLLNQLVTQNPGAVKAVSEATTAQVDENFQELWKTLGTVDGTFYGVPLGSNVKSFVWYSPKMFADGGYEVPETWDDMMALTEQIATDHPDVKPWCAGIGSGVATGWPITDWLEDVMLRTVTPEEYDQWVTNDIKMNDPKVVAALDKAGAILKDDKYVNGGLGDHKTIATTEFQQGGLPILDGACYMHRQASFYGSNFVDAGAEITDHESVDNGIWAFYLPPVDDQHGKPVLVAGEFVTAFADRPEVQDFMTYLASSEWANAKAAASPGGWVTANKNADVDLFNGIDKLSVEILQDEDAVQRFDGSDLMPSQVNTEFWKQMTAWITDKDSQEALDAVQGAWG